MCLTLCDPVAYTVHAILQARILACAAIHFSRASSQPRSPALQADFLPSEPLELLKDTNKRQINWIVQIALHAYMKRSERAKPRRNQRVTKSHRSQKAFQSFAHNNKKTEETIHLRNREAGVIFDKWQKENRIPQLQALLLSSNNLPNYKGLTHKVTEGKGSVDTTHAVPAKCWTKLPSTHLWKRWINSLEYSSTYVNSSLAKQPFPAALVN